MFSQPDHALYYIMLEIRKSFTKQQQRDEYPWLENEATLKIVQMCVHQRTA